MATAGNQSLSGAEKVSLLKSLNIFNETPESILSELAPLMKEEAMKQGALIFKEGEPGECMYIIYSGEIEIHKGSTTLAILQAKEVFGELSLLDAETRSATATAKTDCVVFKIDQEPFYKLIQSRPEVAMGFIKIVSKRLRKLNEKAAEQALRNLF